MKKHNIAAAAAATAKKKRSPFITQVYVVHIGRIHNTTQKQNKRGQIKTKRGLKEKGGGGTYTLLV